MKDVQELVSEEIKFCSYCAILGVRIIAYYNSGDGLMIRKNNGLEYLKL